MLIKVIKWRNQNCLNLVQVHIIMLESRPRENIGAALWLSAGSNDPGGLADPLPCCSKAILPIPHCDQHISASVQESPVKRLWEASDHSSGLSFNMVKCENNIVYWIKTWSFFNVANQVVFVSKPNHSMSKALSQYEILKILILKKGNTAN